MSLPFNLTPEKAATIAAAIVVALFVLAVLLRFAPKRMRSKKFEKRWLELQSKCADPANWPDVLRDADKLLDEALKKRRFKGKTTGERMVSAQNTFSDKDSVWFGHKLYRRYEKTPGMNLTMAQMKKALVGLNKGLRDLGALKRKKDE